VSSEREVWDHWYRQAQAQGYRSRAAFKLIDIDDKRKVIRKGDRVLDAGCAPGSWCEVALQRVGPDGTVVGIDLQAVEWREAPQNLRLIEGDFLQASAESLLEGVKSTRRGPTRFDVVLSDMMAFTTGSQSTDHHASARIVEQLLATLPALLREGGNLVYKIFEGERSPELLQKTRDCFEKAKPYKPAASRGDSVEIFVVGQGFIPEAAPTMPPEPKRGPPSPGYGWGR
jgi:23S rRNA (uridine2552-2'-O)-methyltransferase